MICEILVIYFNCSKILQSLLHVHNYSKIYMLIYKHTPKKVLDYLQVMRHWALFSFLCFLVLIFYFTNQNPEAINISCGACLLTLVCMHCPPAVATWGHSGHWLLVCTIQANLRTWVSVSKFLPVFSLCWLHVPPWAHRVRAKEILFCKIWGLSNVWKLGSQI